MFLVLVATAFEMPCLARQERRKRVEEGGGGV